MIFSPKLKCLRFYRLSAPHLLPLDPENEIRRFCQNWAETEILDWVSPRGQQRGGWVPGQYGKGTSLVLTKYKHNCVENLFLLGEKRKWTQENKSWALNGKGLCWVQSGSALDYCNCGKMWWDSVPKHIGFSWLLVNSVFLCISRQWWIVPEFCA